MGKTYKKQPSKFDDEFASKRSGKSAKHANNRKTNGMKTLNNYVDDDDGFDDDVQIQDEVIIQHTTQTQR